MKKRFSVCLVIYGLYRDNGKENGNYYIIIGYILRVCIGVILLGSVFVWWLNPVRLYSLYKILYQKEDIISLDNGYHSIPK